MAEYKIIGYNIDRPYVIDEITFSVSGGLTVQGQFTLNGGVGSGGTGKLVFNDVSNGYIHAEIDAEGEGTSGGIIKFLTKVDASGVSEKVRINNVGAVGFNGQYGISGEVLTSQGTTGSPIWVAPLQKEAFNMRYSYKSTAYTSGDHFVTDYNASTIMSGTNANTTTGRYTATRAIWMNFMFVCLQWNNTGGTDVMRQSIQRYNSSNVFQEEVKGQTIPALGDSQTITQSTLSMNAVMFLNVGDYAIASVGSINPFFAYSDNNSSVVFSGHNVD